MNIDPFKEYIKQSEPNKRDKGYAWHTAIGLQAVDGLKTSKYLIDTAIKNIEGDISIDEAQELLNVYYEENPQINEADRTEEADKVAVQIAKILSEKAFSFTPNEYMSIHKKLFTGIYAHAGEYREYNITKKEWILNGATVVYPKYKTAIYVDKCLCASCETGVVGCSLCDYSYWKRRLQRKREETTEQYNEALNMGWSVVLVKPCSFNEAIRQDTLNWIAQCVKNGISNGEQGSVYTCG